MNVTVLITGGCGEGFRGNPSPTPPEGGGRPTPTGDPPQPSLFREGVLQSCIRKRATSVS